MEILNNGITIIGQGPNIGFTKKRLAGRKSVTCLCKCGKIFNTLYNSSIVNDKRFFTDYERHIEKCWEKYKGGTKMYGWNNRKLSKAYFIFTN